METLYELRCKKCDCYKLLSFSSIEEARRFPCPVCAKPMTVQVHNIPSEDKRTPENYELRGLSKKEAEDARKLWDRSYAVKENSHG